METNGRNEDTTLKFSENIFYAVSWIYNYCNV